MSQFNQYSLYSYAVQDFKTSCDDKILVDLHKLKSINGYENAFAFVTQTFGNFDAEKHIEYRNGVKLDIYHPENLLIVYAQQNDKQIFGLSWENPEAMDDLYVDE